MAIGIGYKLGSGSNLLNEVRLMAQLGILRISLITWKTGTLTSPLHFCHTSISEAGNKTMQEGTTDTLSKGN
jgi:hypothetical protein